MSRLVSLLIVLLAIAVATPVLAEERLSLSGYMRVRGWHLDTEKYQLNAAETDVEFSETKDTFFDERLRIIGKINVAEGVEVNFRYGSAYNGNMGDSSGANNLDRAHLDLTKGMFHLRAGRMATSLGSMVVDETSADGFEANIKGAVPVRAFVLFTEDTATGDSYTYGANVGHKTDVYAANVFAAGTKDDTVVDRKYYLVGLNFAMPLDAINLFAEVNYFTGDWTETVDAYGLQGYVDVSAAVADNVTVGGQFFYAQGDEDDQQIVSIGNNGNTWDILSDVGAGLNGESFEQRRPYALFHLDAGGDLERNGWGTGVMAARIYSHMKPANDLSVGASAYYGIPAEEDAFGKAFENAYGADLGVSYNIMPRTILAAQASYIKWTADEAPEDQREIGFGTRLQVSF